MILNMRLVIVLLVVFVLAACGRDSSDDAAHFSDESGKAFVEMAAAPVVAPRATGATSAPAAAAAPPAPAAMVLTTEGAATELPEQDVVFVSQQRIIIRTVEMSLEVTDIPATFDGVADLAKEFEGWVVSSDKSHRHTAFISVRVPAERLDEAIIRLRDLAAEVDSEVMSSRDVTDEYVDLTSRLTNMEATEGALLRILERAEKVEDALKVQTELTRVQEEIERFQGRIKFLEQTSAFSLLNVSLRLSPIEMPVDAAEDQTFSVGEFARFRATFRPPVDAEDFVFTWDFGDGSSPVTSDRTAPTTDEGGRVTATVTHIYGDDRDSPYIVEVKITATGEAGVAEGDDTLVATVTREPVIEVFAGGDQVVEEGDEVEFTGSFTRPEGLSDLTFTWDFGDGTAPATGSLGDSLTEASAIHAYTDHRPFSYTATLRITGQSDAGEVEASETINVLVTEAEAWAISGWSAGDTGKTAVRALSGVGIGLAYFFIFAGIFSPVWIIVAVLGIFLRRRARRRSS